MNFHSGEYGVFLCVVFAAYWLLVRHRDARTLWLLGASFLFYASWNAAYLLLIVGSTLVDYELARRIARVPAERARARRALVVVSLVSNLGLLGVFKYHGFFRDNVAALLGVDWPALDVLLPVGISFYTFQSLSYTLDVYWGRIPPAKNLRDFALFVAFFPQLVAGPIVRAATFLPQLERRPALDRAGLHDGVYRILVGLCKKVLVADVLAVEIVDPAFAPGSTVAGFAAWVAMYAYALQIFCDFSGYSDIAIGSAKLFGFDIPENFDRPYLARSLQDFWRRWHISLSSWLRDYLYVPLGGNRRGKVRTYVNLCVTMLLGGLWHGASWNFVVWGGLHGAGLAADRAWGERRLPRLRGALGQVLAIAVTFHLVCVLWVFFRAGADFGVAGSMLERLLQPTSGPATSAAACVGFVLGAATHLVPQAIERRARLAAITMPSWLLGAIVALMLGVLAHAAVPGVPFIYFQF